MDKGILLDIKKEIEPKAKFWNQNSLFLSFGFCAAIFLTSALELFKIIAKDYQFDLSKVTKSIFGIDWYLTGTFLFFIFGFILSVLIARVIDENTKHFNKLLNYINKELNN